MPKHETESVSPSSMDSVSGCLVRLGWMLFGNIALFLLAAFIAQNTQTAFSTFDLAYWAVAAAAIAARYWDIRSFKGQTVTSQPATMAHWRRYVVFLVVGSLVVWGAAHGIARLAAK